jgi:hypothetical protein
VAPSTTPKLAIGRLGEQNSADKGLFIIVEKQRGDRDCSGS